MSCMLFSIQKHRSGNTIRVMSEEPVPSAYAKRRHSYFLSLSAFRLFSGRFVWVLVGLLLGASGTRAQISPGPLSKAHQSLEGSTQCNTCHQFGTSSPTFKCLECHKEIADRLTAKKGYHAILGMKNPNR